MSDNWRSEPEHGVKTLTVSNLISLYIKRGYEWVVFILPKTIIQKLHLNWMKLAGRWVLLTTGMFKYV